MTNFQFLYPWWLLLAPLLLVVLYWLHKSRQSNVLWDNLIDPVLKPFVLDKTGSSRSYLLFVVGLSGVLGIIALSGPSFTKQVIPAYQVKQSTVIALDLSTSMWSQDIKPSRLQRARFELMDLIKYRDEGQTGLVVFAGDAFVVSPITDDASIIVSQVEKLGPEIIKAQGSRVDRAIAESASLLDKAGNKEGHILVVTDGAADRAAAINQAEEANNNGYKVSILMMGTEEGAPIPIAQRGFLKDRQGQVVIPKLDVAVLESIAQAGGGMAVRSVLGDNDAMQLDQYFKQGVTEQLVGDENRQLEHWHNDGIWLLPLLIPLMLMMFRKGFLVLLVAVLIMVPDQKVYAFDWSSLWLNGDQRGQRMLEDQPKAAESMFSSPDWKGAAAYRAGDYNGAMKHYSGSQQADGLYNHGNAAALSGEFEEAIKSYEKAIKQRPDHEDAKANLQAVKDWLDQQKNQSQQQNQQQNQDQNQQKNQSKQQQNNQGQSSQGEEKDGKQSEQPPEQQKAPEEKAKPEKDGDQGKGQEKGGDKSGQQSEDQQDGSEQGQNQSDQELSDEDREKRNAQKQLLKQIPDDPSGLWRRKFQYQYDNREQNLGGDPW